MDRKICRICCKNDGSVYLFDNNDVLRVSDKIMYCCAKISVDESDGLPTHICGDCEVELDASYHFVLKCEATDQQLRTPRLINIEQIDNENEYELTSKLKSEYKLEKEDSDCIDDNTCDNDDYSELLTLETPTDKLKCEIKVKRKQDSYKCKCSHVCANISELTAHKCLSSTVLKSYPCTVCDKVYKQNESLKRHVERNHFKGTRPRNFICEFCGKKFMSKNSMKTHRRIHTGETPFACPECPKKFSQYGSLIRHKLRHSGEKLHVCPICSKKFYGKLELQRHGAVHTNERKFTCPICPMAFKCQSTLRKHRRIHSDNNCYICDYCNQSFRFKGNLKIHITKRHSIKSGYCNICSKHVPNMESHISRHNGERKFQCELCPSSFYGQQGLTLHVNFKHLMTGRFKCSESGCDSAFPSKSMLALHKLKHDNVTPYPCDRCPRCFYRKIDLCKHKLGTHKEKVLD